MTENDTTLPTFTHALRIAVPGGYGADAESRLDRYMLLQLSRRWSGPFARLGAGCYALALDSECEGDAELLRAWFSIALFERVFSPFTTLQPLGEPAPQVDQSLDSAASNRFLRALATVDAAVSSGGDEAPKLHAADLEPLSELLDLARRSTETLSQIEARVDAQPKPPVFDPDAVPVAQRPLINAATSSAVAFSTSAKSLTRRADQAIDLLADAAARIDAAAPPARLEKDGDSVLQRLAETLAELARGQADIAAKIDASAKEPAAPSLTPSLETLGSDVRALVDAVSAQTGALASAPKADETGAELLARMMETAESAQRAADEMLAIVSAWRRDLEAASEEDAMDATFRAAEADAESDASESAAA